MADYELLRAQGAGPAALYAMIGESIGEALTNVMADRAMDSINRFDTKHINKPDFELVPPADW